MTIGRIVDEDPRRRCFFIGGLRYRDPPGRVGQRRRIELLRCDGAAPKMPAPLRSNLRMQTSQAQRSIRAGLDGRHTLSGRENGKLEPVTPAILRFSMADRKTRKVGGEIKNYVSGGIGIAGVHSNHSFCGLS